MLEPIAYSRIPRIMEHVQASSEDQRMQSEFYEPDQPEQREQPEPPEQPVQPDQSEQLERLEEPPQFEQPEELKQPQELEPLPQLGPPPQHETPEQRPRNQQQNQQQGLRSRFEQRKRNDRPQQTRATDWPHYLEPAAGVPPTDELDVRDYLPDQASDPLAPYDAMKVNQMQVAPVGQRNRNQKHRVEQHASYERKEIPTPREDQDEMINTPPENEPGGNPEEADQPEQKNEREVQADLNHQDDAEPKEHSEPQDNLDQQNDQASDFSDAKHQDQAIFDEIPGHSNNQPQHAGRTPGPPQQQKRDYQISKKDLLYYMDDTKLRRNNIASDDQSSTDDESDQKKNNHTLDKNGHVKVSRSSNRVTSGRMAPSRTGPNRTNFSRVYTKRTKVKSARRGFNTKSTTTLRPREKQTKRTFVVTVSGANVTYKLLTMKTHDRRRSGPRRFLEERAPDSVALISLDKAPLPAFRLPRTRRQYMHEIHEHRDPLDDMIPHHRRHDK
ncbi:hypothetical protein HF086_018241 [Spodoptera exigua]|uniref:Uncharacterized protein n=1 Tax=Spodoptera exigua TaxID=7107 RepID=A0A922M6A3_SPOEX|nr:hypothetical protein HF086_018241 [Spodoptera exigua]